MLAPRSRFTDHAQRLLERPPSKATRASNRAIVEERDLGR